jgi:ATP-dependent DNA ligase
MGMDRNHRIPARRDVPVAHVIFDVLYLDDTSLMDQPYEARRELLEKLGLEAEHWQTPPFGSVVATPCARPAASRASKASSPQGGKPIGGVP